MGNKEYNYIYNSNSDSITPIIEYIRYLFHYIKKRSQVYIFASTALLSMVIASNGNIEPSIAVRLLSGTYAISLATYTYNDLYDIKSDRLNNINRLVVNGYVDRSRLMRLVLFLLSLGIILLISINIYTLLIAGICSFLAIAYSHSRFNFKDRFPHKTVVNALGASLAVLIGGYAVENVSMNIILLSIVAFLFLFILAPLGDLQDYKGDMLAGKQTMPVLLGVNTTINIMMILSIAVTTILLLSNSINLLGMIMVVGSNTFMLTTLYYIKGHYNEDTVKRSRHPLRLVYVMNQIAVLISTVSN